MKEDFRGLILQAQGVQNLGERIISTAAEAVIQDNDFTLAVKLDTPAPLTIPLPAPGALPVEAGSVRLRIRDAAGNAGTYPITISATGTTINGSATYVISTDGGNLDFEWTGDAAMGWVSYAQPPGTGSVSDVIGSTNIDVTGGAVKTVSLKGPIPVGFLPAGVQNANDLTSGAQAQLNTKLATNGDGSALTNLNGSAIASGTVAVARLPSGVQNANDLTSPAQSQLNGKLSTTGDASGLTNIPGGAVTGNVPLAAIANALAAGGGAIKGTVLTATTRTETPTIGTSSATQHALPAGTADILTADSAATVTGKSIDAAQLTGNVVIARITTALAAGGNPITGTIVDATTRMDTPSIGTDSSNQHALGSGTGALLDANSSLNASNLGSGTVPIARIPTGSGSSTVTIGNDTRLPPAPSGAGKMLRDTGTAYVAINAGTTSQVLVGGATPNFSSVPLPSGTAFGNVLVNPVVSANTGLCTALAANDPSNTITGLANPDVYRAIRLTLGAGWDGGTVTVNGTDATGQAVTMNRSTAGTSVSIQPWSTITSASKSAVGASSATATIGPDVNLGVSTGHRVCKTTGGILTVNGTIDTIISIVSAAGADPQFSPTTAANGARTYVVTLYLQ